VRLGRLTALLLAASALALLVAAPTFARVQRHQVTVVKQGAVRLIAWDSKTAAKGVCFRLKDGTQKNAFCDRSGKHRLRLAYTSFVTRTGDATVLGGIARRGEESVVGTFADGQTVVLHTRRSKRYRGRQRRNARFWAGQKADVTRLVSLVAKNSKGATVETITVSPPPAPGPVPPSPCPPCPGPPTRSLGAHAHVACPVRPCPL